MRRTNSTEIEIFALIYNRRINDEIEKSSKEKFLAHFLENLLEIVSPFYKVLNQALKKYDERKGIFRRMSYLKFIHNRFGDSEIICEWKDIKKIIEAKVKTKNLELLLEFLKECIIKDLIEYKFETHYEVPNYNELKQRLEYLVTPILQDISYEIIVEIPKKYRDKIKEGSESQLALKEITKFFLDPQGFPPPPYIHHVPYYCPSEKKFVSQQPSLDDVPDYYHSPPPYHPDFENGFSIFHATKNTFFKEAPKAEPSHSSAGPSNFKMG